MKEGKYRIIARTISEKFGLRVRFQGTTAYTDGRDIVLPANIDALTSDSEVVENWASGYLDHEVAHCIFTDFKALRLIRSPFEKILVNCIEDERVERLMMIEFKGTKVSLNFINRETEKTLDTKGMSPEFKFCLSVRDYLLGRKAILDRRIKDLLDAVVLTNVTTYEVVELAQKIVDIIKDKKEEAKQGEQGEPQEEYSEPQDTEGDDGEGDGQSTSMEEYEKKEKESDSEGDEDSEDNEDNDTPSEDGLSKGEDLPKEDEEGKSEGDGKEKGKEKSKGPSGKGNSDSDSPSEVSESEKKEESEASESTGEENLDLDTYDIPEDSKTEALNEVLEEKQKELKKDKKKGEFEYTIFSTDYDDYSDIPDGLYDNDTNLDMVKIRCNGEALGMNIKDYLTSYSELWKLEQSRGLINSNRLVKARVDENYRTPFKALKRSVTNDVAVNIVVDASSSMCSNRTDTIKTLAELAFAFDSLGINFQIRDYRTGDSRINVKDHYELQGFTRRNESVCMRRYKKYEDLFNPNKLFAYKTNHSTPMYEALKLGGEELVDRNESRKILVFITDGEPSFVNPPNILELANTIKKTGISIIPIGINVNISASFGEDNITVKNANFTHEVVEKLKILLKS